MVRHAAVVFDRRPNPRLRRRTLRIHPPQLQNSLIICAFLWPKLDSSLKSQLKSPASQMPDSIHTHVFRTRAVTTALAVAAAAFVAPWRVTMGLALGGLLAIFSHSWLKNSAAAAIQLSTTGGRPQL